mmetsp:Transcript_98383/g.120507  ORF Transcript_98383/g.120507 Transcript_98383/m.120507 type:complete len:239 (+) Transcript_98383:87-803(+)
MMRQKKLKVEGNDHFKQKDYKKALKCYTRIFMHLGMNPCMNLSQMTGQGKGTKDPIQQEMDALRLTAFNNIAAVYAKMENWEECKDNCSRVLKHDDKNIKALFRRGLAHRKLSLFELARSDLLKANELLNGKHDVAIERELKLLKKDEERNEREFYRKMKKQMERQKALKQKKNNNNNNNNNNSNSSSNTNNKPNKSSNNGNKKTKTKKKDNNAKMKSKKNNTNVDNADMDDDIPTQF